MNTIYSPIEQDSTPRQAIRDEHSRIRYGLVELLRTRDSIEQVDAAKLLECSQMMLAVVVQRSPSYFRSFVLPKFRASVELVAALRR